MIGLSLRRPVSVTMVVAVVVVFGAISYSRLGRDLLPDISYPSLTIQTRYDGAAPQEVEDFITEPLESALATVRGKRSISSVSREGMSLITVEFEWGEDMQIALLNVREKLDAARFRQGFPEDADRPNILRWDPSAKPIVGLAITGETSILLLKEAVRDVIKPRLEQLEGVAFAQISGDVERVIDVEIDREKINLFGLDLSVIATAIGNANANIPGGTIKKGNYRYSLRTLGEFDSVKQINSVVVGRRNGVDIRVQDVAFVRDTTKDRESMATVSGKEAIGLLVYKEAGANTIESTRLVKKLLREFEESKPEYKITLAFEEAQFIEQALNNVWVSLLFGGLFAFVVLVLFLRDLKSPLFVFTSIPIAIIFTLVAMYFAGFSLNIMSLGGLALGVGMLVDNSIVVLENIYRYREQGKGPMDAAYLGTKEVALPVAASTLTTIAVFFPIVYLKGVAGALFGEQAWTVTISLLSSLLVSLTVLPLLTAVSSILKGRDSQPARLTPMPKHDAEKYPRGFQFWKWWEYLIAGLLIFYIADYFKLEWKWSLLIILGVGILPLVMFLLKIILSFLLSLLLQLVTFVFLLITKASRLLLDSVLLPAFDFFYNGFDKIYHVALSWALDRKLIVLTLALSLLVIAILTVPSLKKEMMPKSATGQFSVDMKLAPGTALELTALVVEDLERYLSEDEAVEVVFSQIGSSDANLAQLLRDSGTNTANLAIKLNEDFVSLDEVYRLSEKIRIYAKKVPGMAVSVNEVNSSFEELLASEGGAGLVVQVEGELFRDLYLASDLLVEKLAQIDGVRGVNTSLSRDFPQMKIRLNRDGIERYGLDIGSVGKYLSGGMRGELATEYKEFDRNIDVRVRFREDDRENFDRILSAKVTAPNKTLVPLSELLIVETVKEAKEIRRVNQRRVGMISLSLSGKKVSEVVPAVQKVLNETSLPRGVITRVVGEQQGIESSFSQLMMALMLSSILVYMIMAGQFESLRFPFVVIFTLPMGLIGTIFMLYTFDQSINIMSLIGLIVLSGIVVNDAIVKVDFINQARREGAGIREAVLQASAVRLRPILMTTATTVLGLLPMASGIVPWVMNKPFFRSIIEPIDKILLSMDFTTLSQLFSPRGAEIQRPLALVVIGGLSLATLLTLLLIPILYETFASKDQRVAAAGEGSRPPEAQPETSEEPA